ncbi:hypothetical protein T12_6396, partial [Trichinella patagoniensis]
LTLITRLVASLAFCQWLETSLNRKAQCSRSFPVS